jgi:lactate dehydrogenase-like 2-hydroxyacid dehydrogenase
MNETVLVTQPEYLKAEDVFRSATAVRCAPVAPDEGALAGAVASHSVRVIIVGVPSYRGPLYEALGKLGGGLIARFGVGHDGISKPLARQHGIIVTNTPGVLDASVAEHTVWLMGCLARHIARLDARVRAGGFDGRTGTELRGKTLGILGLGNIGRRVAAMAHFGFGMKVIASGRAAAPEPLANCGVECFITNVEELFRQSDVVSVHLPDNSGTQRFVNATRLAWLKPGALLINTARGAVLDEAALFDALAGGRMAGAALDVFEHEPYQPVEPAKDLRKLANVVLTPHVGSNTREANRRMAQAALENVEHFFAGRIDRLTRVDQSLPKSENRSTRSPQ